jgi:hypothetical protein
MKKTRGTIGLVSLSLLLLALAAGCAGQPGQVDLSATEYDFGTIPNDKSVSQVFEVRNVGRGKLEIVGVSTSCGCTTAQVSKRQLARGETAELEVTYDPLAHEGATGRFMRIVYIRSNDPEVPEATLTIRVTVVAS